MKKKRCIKITLDECGATLGTYVQPIEDIFDAIDGEFDDIENMMVGTKWTLEIVEMSQAAYDNLQEFQGY